jgi:hypothetical protein
MHGRYKIAGRSGSSRWKKKFPGHTIILEEIQASVWLLKLGQFIPDIEEW